MGTCAGDDPNAEDGNGQRSFQLRELFNVWRKEEH